MVAFIKYFIWIIGGLLIASNFQQIDSCISSNNSPSQTTTTTAATPSGTDSSTCGTVIFTNNVKIVGGIVATQGSWPSIAYIRWNYKADYLLPTGVTVTYTAPTSSCDGTLITTRKILTAAHCIPTSVRFSYLGVSYTGDVKTSSYYPTFGSMFSVYLGLHDKTSIVNTGTYSAPTIKVTVSEQRLHASYDDTTLQNDIALLYLAADVTLNNYIQTACIPTSSSTSYPGVNIDVYAAGWGLLSSSDSTTPNLLYNVKLSTYAASQCPYSGFDNAGMICAGWSSGGKGICQGDSGGPLFYLNPSTNKYILVGVTSFTSADGCGLTGPQNGFARVSNYLTWIDTQSFSSKSIDNFVNLSPIKVRISDNLTHSNNTHMPNDATVQVYQG